MLYLVFQPMLVLWILTTLWSSYDWFLHFTDKKMVFREMDSPKLYWVFVASNAHKQFPSPHFFFPNKSFPIFHWWGAHHPLFYGLKLEIQERACDSGSCHPVSCPVNASYSPGFSYWHRNACIRLKTSVQTVGLTELSFPLSLHRGEKLELKPLVSIKSPCGD